MNEEHEIEITVIEAARILGITRMSVYNIRKRTSNGQAPAPVTIRWVRDILDTEQAALDVKRRRFNRLAAVLSE